MLIAKDPHLSSTRYPLQEERSVLSLDRGLNTLSTARPRLPSIPPSSSISGSSSRRVSHSHNENISSLMPTRLQWALRWLKMTSLRRIQQVWRLVIGHLCNVCNIHLTLTWLSEAPLDKRYIATFIVIEIQRIQIKIHISWKGESGEVRLVSGGWVLMTDDAWRHQLSWLRWKAVSGKGSLQKKKNKKS